jgi:hypothetical protein
MEGMREAWKISLSRSLQGLSDEDRLAAAWTIVCGKTMAVKAFVVGYADGIVHVQVEHEAWLHQLFHFRGQLASEMERIARVRVSEIHFKTKRNDRQ